MIKILKEEQYFKDIKEIDQEFTSANTSINSTKLPAVFSKVTFQPNTINIDYGGGKFDNVADYLSKFKVINLVYDPYNRSSEHNKKVLDLVDDNNGADTITCSNVLNVIKEPKVRLNVISNIYKLLKPEGIAYFSVYEGDRSSVGKETTKGYQLNKPIVEYVSEVEQLFSNVVKKGSIIIAKK